MLLTILKWAAIGIGAVIVVVTTTVITVKLVSKGNSGQGLAAVSPAYSAMEPAWAVYDGVDQIRGTTADDSAALFMLQLSLGYDEKDKEASVEIGSRKREIQDLVGTYISQKKAADLVPANYPTLKEEIKQLINSKMTTGKVKSVMFQTFIVQK
jgi:flagellar protein FliL